MDLFMKVVSINCDKGYTSKNGITYFNYYVLVAIPKLVNGVEGYELVKVTLMDSAVRNLIEQNFIKNYKELEGMDINIYRKFPAYLDKIEKMNNVIKYDLVTINKK